jgi:nitrile hydratase accessory protein
VTDSSVVAQLAADGPLAPPRSNGELLFDAPWESRAFGIGVALAEAGTFTFADLQHALIRSIAEWEALDRPDHEYHYYECWLSAVERLVTGTGDILLADVDALAAEIESRPPGHDHDHDHDHDRHGHG